MKYCYIFTAKKQIIEPKQIADALESAGFPKTEAVTKRRGFGGYICELNYLAGRMPIIVEVSEDFHAGDDVATSEQKMADDSIPDEEIRARIRHMISVRAMENTNESAFMTTMKFIQEETGGILFDDTQQLI